MIWAFSALFYICLSLGLLLHTSIGLLWSQKIVWVWWFSFRFVSWRYLSPQIIRSLDSWIQRFNSFLSLYSIFCFVKRKSSRNCIKWPNSLHDQVSWRLFASTASASLLQHNSFNDSTHVILCFILVATQSFWFNTIIVVSAIPSDWLLLHSSEWS